MKLLNYALKVMPFDRALNRAPLSMRVQHSTVMAKPLHGKLPNKWATQPMRQRLNIRPHTSYNTAKRVTILILRIRFVHGNSGGTRGRQPGRRPPPHRPWEKLFLQGKEIISYGCASSARLLICIYFFWGLGAMANGHWPFLLLRLCSRKSKFYYKLY